MSTLIASAANTASNAAVNFVSRSRTRKRNRPARSFKGHEQIAGLLRHPLPYRMRRYPEHVDLAGGDLSTANSTYRRLSRTVSTVKKSTARTLLAWARRNCREEIAERVGAGSTPARCRMGQTVLAPILKPRRDSSPWMRR